MIQKTRCLLPCLGLGLAFVQPGLTAAVNQREGVSARELTRLRVVGVGRVAGMAAPVEAGINVQSSPIPAPITEGSAPDSPPLLPAPEAASPQPPLPTNRALPPALAGSATPSPNGSHFQPAPEDLPPTALPGPAPEEPQPEKGAMDGLAGLDHDFQKDDKTAGHLYDQAKDAQDSSVDAKLPDPNAAGRSRRQGSRPRRITRWQRVAAWIEGRPGPSAMARMLIVDPPDRFVDYAASSDDRHEVLARVLLLFGMLGVPFFVVAGVASIAYLAFWCVLRLALGVIRFPKAFWASIEEAERVHELQHLDGKGLRCAFCHFPIEGGQSVDSCKGCKTVLHSACHDELRRRCATLGCQDERDWLRVTVKTAEEIRKEKESLLYPPFPF